MGEQMAKEKVRNYRVVYSGLLTVTHGNRVLCPVTSFVASGAPGFERFLECLPRTTRIPTDKRPLFTTAFERALAACKLDSGCTIVREGDFAIHLELSKLHLWE